MYRQVPNQLTMLRLVLAGVFFLVLNQYRYQGGAGGSAWLMVAIPLFVLAALTDLLDGYLARRWGAESTFGRIMDPFCDKVLILGSYIYLAGPRFAIGHAVEQGELFTMVSGVYPWMVTVMLARELLVTGVRGELEGTGTAFGASIYGKVKMVLQSVTVPVVLLVVWADPFVPGRAWLAVCRDALVYMTVFVTVISGLPYIVNAGRAMRKPDGVGSAG